MRSRKREIAWESPVDGMTSTWKYTCNTPIPLPLETAQGDFFCPFFTRLRGPGPYFQKCTHFAVYIFGPISPFATHHFCR